MKMTIEQLKESFANPAMTSIINMTRPNIDMTTSNYKVGFIDGGINGEHKPYRYDPVGTGIIGKLTGKEAAEYELGFYDGIMSENPKLELNKRYGMKFGSLL